MAVNICPKELQFRFCGRARYISDISELQDFALLIITFNNDNLFNYFQRAHNSSALFGSKIIYFRQM